MALQEWGAFADGTVVVSVDVVSGKCAGVSVANTSGKTVTVDVWGPSGQSKISGKECPPGTTTQTISNPQRFDWATATADWRLSVTGF